VTSPGADRSLLVDETGHDRRVAGKGVIQPRAVAGPRDRFDHSGRLGPCFRFGDSAQDGLPLSMATSAILKW
jgi:hypothetical protein